MNSKTAILLFSRTARSEARTKQLTGGSDRNIRLLERMIRRTHRLAVRTGLPVFQVDEQQQLGASFGERINHAAARVIAKGYSKIIILGNDAPQLRLSDLRRAQRSLEAGGSVLGPDHRGGAYLIGVGAEQLGISFAALPWQTDKLGTELADLLAAAPEQNTLLLCQSKQSNLLYLRSLGDLNSSDDLGKLLGLLAGNATISWLLHELKVNTFEHFVSASCRFVFSATGRRGPPVLG